MIQDLYRGWERFWFRPVGPAGLIAARTLVAANALWILLSRRDLTDVLGWPPEFWASVSGWLKLRFLIFGFPLNVEQGLFALLHLALVTALLGLFPRVSCLVAGVLLYHFAPLDEILNYAMGPYFGGTTLPVLALLVFAAVPVPRLGAGASAEFGWPLRFAQVLLAFHYFWPGYAKLFHSGLLWMSGDNIRESLFLVATFGPEGPSWAGFVASRPLLYWLIAVATIPAEVLFPLALFSRTAARIMVPLMLLGHLLIVPVFGLFFFNMPLLLLFVDWDWAVRRLRELVRKSRRDESLEPR